MLIDEVDRGSIEKMVRHFYAVLIEDDLVGPYFIRALGDDLSNDKWYEHFQTLNKFWLMMMTGEKGYMGDPFLPHVFIGQLYPETFERWLKLFKEVISEFFVPEIADKFYRKAEILSAQFIENLELEDEEED
ncbi:Truncated hemoglobins [hydrothermal vent metagenome]|uniref:Truncated hemoglobins n=1 Tax=hydrothermal vent metagenome TaxID=652676 RepID=A0A1W1CGF2_9ZZZZ